jgi:SAM-dependent methyltransferase
MQQEWSPLKVASDRDRWFRRSLGRSLLRLEQARLREMLSRLYGPVALQLGASGEVDLLENSAATTRIVIDPLVTSVAPASPVRAEPAALPFLGKSVHTVVLPHVLEFCIDPHQVLREVDRVLMPEGHVVITGFNPISLWGLSKLLAHRRSVPWRGRFFSLHRVKDWLSLLGFEHCGGAMLQYLPPVARTRLRRRLAFLEHAGNRWWPMLGAVYIVVAKKREFGVTPLQPEWKRNGKLAPGLAGPVARGMRRGQG